MGFFDKISATVKQIKDENKYMARTTKRINNETDFCGSVNYALKDGDFRQMSYISIENGQGVIYNTGDEDYIFCTGDIIAFDYLEDGRPIRQGDVHMPTLRYAVTFKDGKKAEIDLLALKITDFVAKFNLR